MKPFARIVLASSFALAAGAASLLLDIPGGKRFNRYCSYPDMKTLMDTEKDDVSATFGYDRDGTNFIFVVLKPCRFLASGPAVLVYDFKGRLFDMSRDEGDDGRFQRDWPLRWSCARAETVRRLKAMKMPELSFYAPATMKDFAEYMNQATKDFDDPRVPEEKRGIKFICKESVAAMVGPEKPKRDEPLTVNDSFRTTTAWDALTNVCDSVGCKFEVYHGKVEIK